MTTRDRVVQLAAWLAWFTFWALVLVAMTFGPGDPGAPASELLDGKG